MFLQHLDFLGGRKHNKTMVFNISERKHNKAHNFFICGLWIDHTSVLVKSLSKFCIFELRVPWGTFWVLLWIGLWARLWVREREKDLWKVLWKVLWKSFESPLKVLWKSFWKSFESSPPHTPRTSYHACMALWIVCYRVCCLVLVVLSSSIAFLLFKKSLTQLWPRMWPKKCSKIPEAGHL